MPYGSWHNHNGGSALSVEDSVAELLGEFVADYRLDDLLAAYRALINAALPPEISLHGDLFFGPYPAGPDAGEVIASAIRSVDAGELAVLFARSAGNDDLLVFIYEDNSGAVYLSPGGSSYGWPLGPVTPDMYGAAARDAAACSTGDWTPGDDLIPASVKDCTLIATCPPGSGLVVERDRNGNPVAGAGGQRYLGIS